MAHLLERYSDRILGVLACFDRVVVRGRFREIDFAQGMEMYLRARKIRLFDLPKFAMPFRDAIVKNAERLARENGIEVQYLPNRDERNADIVARILERRGHHPGLVAILSAVESCRTFDARYDRDTGRSFLQPRTGRCLHYYFYFIDEDLGLCFLRVATWCPYGVQAYFNGHNVLAAKLQKAGIDYKMVDNAFVDIADWREAQRLADESDTRRLHEKFDHYARQFCPAVTMLGYAYSWSIAQVEYSTDVVFRVKTDLQPIYDGLVRTVIHAVKPDQIATFLARKPMSLESSTDEVETQFQTRVMGTRVKHRLGPSSIKMYDKHGLILRVETTTCDPSWFTHYRTVVHRDGTTSHELAPLKKSLYSLHDLRQLAVAANRRYLDFLSCLEDPAIAVEAVSRLSDKTVDAGRSYRGFNFFSTDDLQLFTAIIRGENSLQGFRNSHLRKHMPHKSAGQISRIIKRLWLHGLIKKVGHTYKYYITELGRSLITMGLKLKQLVFLPQLANTMRT